MLHLWLFKDLGHLVDRPIWEGNPFEDITPLAIGLVTQHLTQLPNQLQPVLNSSLIACIFLLGSQTWLAHSLAKLCELLVVATANSEEAIRGGEGLTG